MCLIVKLNFKVIFPKKNTHTFFVKNRSHTGCPKNALQFLSIRAQSRCDPDLDHISIGPGLTETVTLFLGHPVVSWGHWPKPTQTRHISLYTSSLCSFEISQGLFKFHLDNSRYMNVVSCFQCLMPGILYLLPGTPDTGYQVSWIWCQVHYTGCFFWLVPPKFG